MKDGIKDMIRTAFGFATIHHSGQYYGSFDYVAHPLLVARHFEEPYRIITSALHDVVEDTDVTIQDIERVFGSPIVEAVDAITHREGETYRAYISRCSRNPIARDVKVADLREHLWSMEIWYPEYKDLRKRYTRALEFLGESQGTSRMVPVEELDELKELAARYEDLRR